MAIAAFGVNHLSAPLALRERLAFAADELPQALSALRAIVPARDSTAGSGAAILSTCNRCELYLASDQPQTFEPEVRNWLAKARGVDARVLAEHSYYLHQDQAVRHAFRVASGLDSMVLGEPQILGQLKAAVQQAAELSNLGSTLDRMFQRTFSVAKEVRSTTAIGLGSISMAAASARVAERIFESISDTRVLLVGAGEMIELVGTHFKGKKPRGLSVMNRSRDRGEALALRLGADYAALSDLPQRLAQFDVVITCTASTLPLIGLGAVTRAMAQRRQRPMLIVDLAVPRDVEAEVGQLWDVYLYTVDDLQAWVQDGLDQRRAAASEAQAIVDTRVDDFMAWLGKRDAVPTIQAIQSQSHAWQNAELERARAALAGGAPAEQAMAELAHRLSRKHLHGTLAALNKAPRKSQLTLLDSAQKFFLDDEHR